MKKPLKVLSTATMAALFATTTLTPVAAAETPVQQSDVAKYIIEKDGVLLSLDIETYKFYLAELDYKLPEGEVVYGVTDTDGNHYQYETYKAALAEVDYESTKDAVKLLQDQELNEDVEVLEGIVDEDLNLTSKEDEQPEDRLNETFFYNFAA